MKRQKATYNRNSFFDVLGTANHELGLDISGGELISFGEREPDSKIVDASTKFNITVVEGFGKNVETVSSKKPDWNVNHNLIEDYVHTEEFQNSEYDVAWWYHGPEHVESVDEAISIIKEMKKRSKLVLLSMPHGIYEQGKFMNNDLEIHRCAFYADDFECFGDDAVFNFETPIGNDKTSIDVFIKGDLA